MEIDDSDVENEEIVYSSLDLKQEQGKTIVRFQGPFISIPNKESLVISINAKKESDIPHVGEQLWSGALITAEYLLNL